MAEWVDNAELMDEIAKSKDGGRMTEKLGSLLIVLVDGVGEMPEYRKSPLLDDMKGDALLALSSKCLKFDPLKGTKPFAYATAIAINKFKERLGMEKAKHGDWEAPMPEGGLAAVPMPCKSTDRGGEVSASSMERFRDELREFNASVEGKPMSEGEKVRAFREMRESREAKRVAKMRSLKAAATDAVLLQVLLLVDTYGVPKKDIERATGIKQRFIERMVRGENNPALRERRAKELGLGIDEYVARCRSLARHSSQRRKR